MARFWGVLFVVLLGACGRQAPEKTSPRRVVTGELVFDFEPTPFPFPARGLSFQMGAMPEGLQATRPIGDGRLDSGGNIYLSFPRQGAVVAFEGKAYQPRFWGSAQLGGGGEALGRPVHLGLGEDSLDCASVDGSELVRLNLTDGRVSRLSLGPKALPLDANRFARQKGDGGSLVIAEDSGRVMAEFPIELHPIGRPSFAEDGSLVALDKRAVFFFVDAEQQVLAAWRFPAFIDGNPATLSAYVKDGERLWILFRLEGQPHSALAVVDVRGTVRHYWSLPFPADGLDLNHEQILLFQRQEGRAQTHQRLE